MVNGTGISLLLWQDTYDGVSTQRHSAASRTVGAHRLTN